MIPGFARNEEYPVPKPIDLRFIVVDVVFVEELLLLIVGRYLGQVYKSFVRIFGQFGKCRAILRLSNESKFGKKKMTKRCGKSATDPVAVELPHTLLAEILAIFG
jgi:hypothetical protein